VCVTPETLLDYIYGVLHAPAYREKYAEFLKTDFPRIPYPKDAEEWAHYVAKGARLRSLHLMEAADIDNHEIGYPVEGDDTVEKPHYEASSQRVYINAIQYFDNVSPQAWEAYIGGYQPAQKWLKDRKGQQLTYEDIAHYSRVLYVLGCS